MAISPGTYNITVQRRADHSVVMNFKDSNNAAVNLTGSTVISQLWDSSRTTKAADVTITVTNAAGGEFKWALTDVQTAALTADEYKYDILLTTSTGTKEYWIQGTVFMSQGYSS
mgnify:CR=1 FL=1|tara:strand:- start:509 stop:850 length:342 start_codon:yes stop_codon:yes gene_type:complete